MRPQVQVCGTGTIAQGCRRAVGSATQPEVRDNADHN